MNTFGYNCVIQVAGALLKKVATSQMYERNFVEIDGSTRNDELIQCDFENEHHDLTRIFLRLGPPTVEFAPAATDDRSIGILVPMRIVIFACRATLPGVWTRKPMEAPILGVIETLVLGLSPVTFERNDSGDAIKPRFSDLTETAVSFFVPFANGEPPLPEDLPYPLERSAVFPVNDDLLNAALEANGIDLTAEEIKKKVVEQITQGAIKGTEVCIPNTGFDTPLVQRWDFRILSVQREGIGADGIDILLYADTDEGQGQREKAGNTISPDADPPYQFAINISRAVFLDLLGRGLDERGFYDQGGSLNTPDNATGFMAVPATGNSSYTIPATPDGNATTVTLTAPDGGRVRLTVPAGGFLPRSRVQLTNLDTGVSEQFTAGDDGAAVIEIDANAENHLALKVLAISAPGEPETVFWRPKCTLKEDALHLDVDFYRYEDDLCDVEGDVSVDIGLAPDPYHRLGVELYPDASIDAPWWLDIGQFIVKLFTLSIIDLMEKFEREIEQAVKEQVEIPTPNDAPLAMFLERVETHEDGIAFSGYADAGWIREKDRRRLVVPELRDLDNWRELATSMTLGESPNSLTLTWETTSEGLVLSTGYYEVALDTSSNPASMFWNSRYQDALGADYAGCTVPIAQDRTVMFWVRQPRNYAKVLAEWDGIFLTAYYIQYEPRVVPRATIVDNLEAIVTRHVDTGMVQLTWFRYEGSISLETFKYYRSETNRQEMLQTSGFEHWYWDEVEVPLGGTITQPGVTVTWNNPDLLYVTIDQTQMAWSGTPITNHTVRFNGEDFFGDLVEARQWIYTPGFTQNRTDYPIIDVYPRDDILPDPILELPSHVAADPARIRTLTNVRVQSAGVRAGSSQLPPAATAIMLRQVLGDHPLVERALRTLTEAIGEGRAVLDGRVARLLVAALTSKKGSGRAE